MSNAEKIQFLLDNGMNVRQIANECRVTQLHINETLRGNRKGGRMLDQRLDVIVDEMKDSIAYLEAGPAGEEE